MRWLLKSRVPLFFIKQEHQRSQKVSGDEQHRCSIASQQRAKSSFYRIGSDLIIFAASTKVSSTANFSVLFSFQNPGVALLAVHNLIIRFAIAIIRSKLFTVHQLVARIDTESANYS
ncbi:hypothetical protein GUJ93_ZPchr0010g8097 [Zizania palustris]|uniref:Uncharacterized protein n=1 Tax=Zizania palustris TaxID=103762 RepID=A0A8J5TMB2_ZIZPA|nr:hypothetical protein GUJ93_ZPchr0010g8097 [Zizania palustris]